MAWADANCNYREMSDEWADVCVSVNSRNCGSKPEVVTTAYRLVGEPHFTAVQTESHNRVP